MILQPQALMEIKIQEKYLLLMASVGTSNIPKLISYHTPLMAPSYLAWMSLKHTNVITIQQLFSDSKQNLRLKLHIITFVAVIPIHCLYFAPTYIFAEDREYAETEHRQGKLLTHNPALSTPTVSPVILQNKSWVQSLPCLTYPSHTISTFRISWAYQNTQER